jgi:DNA-binding CsgD family transcriptional regulator
MRQQRGRLDSVEFVSLDAPVGAAEAGLTLEETLADVTAIPVDEQVEERDHMAARRSRLSAALEKLSEREKRILVLRHVREMSVAEVAACEGVTEGRIHRIERDARIKAGGVASSATSSNDPYRLSEIELKVLQSTAAGDTTLETAKRLRRSIQTVKTHRSAVIKKLRARNMCHALAKAYQVGILS